MTQTFESTVALLDSEVIASFPEVHVPLTEATAENIAEFGIIINEEVPNAGLSIPFYKGSVIEGHNYDFIYRDHAVIRSAKILRRKPQLDWLERHLNMTQLFIGLGARPYIMVLAPANQAEGQQVPDLDKVKAFVMPGGTGLMLHRGTWHDFPFAYDEYVTVLTANSAEVVQALIKAKGPNELFDGDVHKINIPARLKTRLVIDLPETGRL